jgi:hypothetical protein
LYDFCISSRSLILFLWYFVLSINTLALLLSLHTVFCLLGDGVGVWLEVVMMLLLPPSRFNIAFGPTSDQKCHEARDSTVQAAWAEIKLPYFMLTSVVLSRVMRYGKTAMDITLALRGRGLSNLGSELLASMGLTTPKSTYYRQRTELTNRIASEHKFVHLCSSLLFDVWFFLPF